MGTCEKRKGETSMKQMQILVCEKRELTSKILYWENQKRKAEKRLKKLLIEVEQIEKKIAKEKLA